MDIIYKLVFSQLDVYTRVRLEMDIIYRLVFAVRCIHKSGMCAWSILGVLY